MLVRVGICVYAETKTCTIPATHIVRFNGLVILSLHKHARACVHRWTDCLFWDFSRDAWSSDGCSVVAAASTFYEARCACNHLTSFAAGLSLAPNELSVANIEQFFEYVRRRHHCVLRSYFYQICIICI